MTTLTHEQLSQIYEAISPYLHRTPLVRSDTLSRMTGHEVYLKEELFQKTGSYKPRGMLWALMQLTDEERAAGVLTFSAGNAAQGLAYAGAILGVSVTVTMPATASLHKAEATRGYGAEVIMHGTPQECLIKARQISAERNLTFISSYDDVNLMRGHATLAKEILEDLPSVDAIIVGVGGGGMLGGTALALEALGSAASLYGVEPMGAPAMSRSFDIGRAVSLEHVSTVADGLAAPGAGAACVEVSMPRTSGIELVDDNEIISAMRTLMERCKLLAEPAGSAAVAGLMSGRIDLQPGSTVVCVVSGGNIDLQRLKHLL